MTCDDTLHLWLDKNKVHALLELLQWVQTKHEARICIVDSHEYGHEILTLVEKFQHVNTSFVCSCHLQKFASILVFALTLYAIALHEKLLHIWSEATAAGINNDEKSHSLPTNYWSQPITRANIQNYGYCNLDLCDGRYENHSDSATLSERQQNKSE